MAAALAVSNAKGWLPFSGANELAAKIFLFPALQVDFNGRA